MATLPYETSPERPATRTGLLGVGIASLLATPVWALFFPFLVSGVRELFDLPFIAYAVIYLAVPALLPATLARTPILRIVCMCCLFGLALGWYFGLGFDGLLSKAWRRGL